MELSPELNTAGRGNEIGGSRPIGKEKASLSKKKKRDSIGGLERKKGGGGTGDAAHASVGLLRWGKRRLL